MNIAKQLLKGIGIGLTEHDKARKAAAQVKRDRKAKARIEKAERDSQYAQLLANRPKD